ncbi:MAG: tetratricopeptide repeat protein [Terriglobia bacterium]
MRRVLRKRLDAGFGGEVRRGFWKPVGLLLALAMMTAPGLKSQSSGSKQTEIQAHLQKAQQALRTSDFAAAESEFRAIVALDPNNLDARGNVGVMLYFQSQWAAAAEQFRKVLEGQPKNWKVEAFLGMCEERQGHPEEARKLLAGALPYLPAGAFQTQAGLELAQVLYRTGDLDGAVDVVRILLPANPNNPDVLYTTARVYADLANRSRDALLLAAPDSGRTHQLMAEVLINRGETRAAIVQYRRALEVEPQLRGIHYELGEAILQDSRQASALDGAEKEFLSALAENPADAKSEYRLGTVCALRRDFKGAIEHYNRSLEIQPDDAYAHQGLGAALIKTSEPEKAIEQLLAAIRLDPLYSISHYQLSTVYKQLGREADAAHELAEFEKLEDSRKKLDQVYVQTRGEFPESNPTAPDAPKN